MEGFLKRYDEVPIKEIWLVDIEEDKEKPRSNHLPRIDGYLHGLYYTLVFS